VSSCGPRRTSVAQAGPRQPHVIFTMTNAMRFCGIAVPSHAGGIFRTGPIWPPQFPKISQERLQKSEGFTSDDDRLNAVVSHAGFGPAVSVMSGLPPVLLRWGTSGRESARNGPSSRIEGGN